MATTEATGQRKEKKVERTDGEWEKKKKKKRKKKKTERRETDDGAKAKTNSSIFFAD